MEIKEIFSEAKRVLIVDDLGSARKIIVRLLTSLGLPETCIAQAADGVQALETVKSGTIGLVISDHVMPKMTGMELLQAIRSDDSSKTLPFIMITSMSSKEIVSQAALNRVTDFVAKPFDKEVLLAKITSICGGD